MKYKRTELFSHVIGGVPHLHVFALGYGEVATVRAEANLSHLLLEFDSVKDNAAVEVDKHCVVLTVRHEKHGVIGRHGQASNVRSSLYWECSHGVRSKIEDLNSVRYCGDQCVAIRCVEKVTPITVSGLICCRRWVTVVCSAEALELVIELHFQT